MLGALLIQPQMLARMQGRSAEQQLFDETIALLHRLVVSPALAEELAPAFTATLQGTADRVRARFQGGWPAFEPRLRALIAPLAEGLQRQFGGAAPADAAALLRRIADALDELDDLPALLSDAGIRAALGSVARALAQDLGLSQQALRDEAAAFLKELAVSLRGLQDVSAPARATAQAVACLLDRVRVELLPRMPPLDFGVDRLIELVLGRLRWSGFETLRSQAACLLGKAKAVLRALADVVAASVNVSAGVPRARPRAGRRAGAARPHAVARAAARAGPPGPRANDRHYAWYGSWLFRRRLQNVWVDFAPRYPGDEVWLDQSRTRLSLRRVKGTDLELARVPQPLAWHEMAPFGSASEPLRAGDSHGTRFSFGVFPPAFLEVFTQVAAVVTEAGRSLWHVVRTAGSPKEYGQLTLVVWTLARALTAAAAKAPVHSLLAREMHASPSVCWVFSPFVTWLMVLAIGAEGTHDDVDEAGSNFMYYATLMGADALNTWLPDRALRGGHDFLLSLFTLINQTGPVAPGEPVPSNFEHGQPFIELGEFLGQLLLVLVIPRELYSYPGYETTYFLFFHWFLMAPLLSAAGATIGALLAGLAARRIDAPGLARQAGFAALRSLFTFNLYLYLFREGDTDGGRYTTPYKRDGKDYVNPPHLPFRPYPEKSSSPYLLPYMEDSHLFVGQAHFGAFSHMPMHKGDRPQVYAIDFAHDFRQPVLAVRDGTVVDWFDWVDDNDEPSEDADQQVYAKEAWKFMVADGRVPKEEWRGETDGTKRNYILVRHDARLDEHDLSFDGAPVTTYAMYMHGAKAGVRDAFATYEIGPEVIIGTKVKRGHTIMLAGNTGMSMHNHLHLQVMPEPPPPDPADPVTRRLDENKVPDVTLPFVFADVDEDDGVPRRLTWYTSQNVPPSERPEAPAPLPVPTPFPTPSP